MRKFMLGILIGGILLSGGWFAWGAIQSEVGLNLYSLQTQTWGKQRAIPLSGALGDTLVDADTGVQVLNAPAVASALYATSGATFTPLRISNLQSTSGTASASGAALNVVNSPSPFLRSSGSQAFCMASGGILEDTITITPPTFTTCIPDVRAFTFEHNGTTENMVRSNFNQSTTGVTTNAAGTAVNMTTTPMSKFTLIVDRTGGATDAVEIDLECSIDGTIWPANTMEIVSIVTLAVEPARAGSTTSTIPCNYMRYNVVTVGAGNTLTIQLLATR
jgi:hypothetical protein